uniref:Extended FMRFamide-12 n=1 Tax=Mantophasma kudubergense TaxID=1037657 RepID=FAR12_MANKU|nr:RecName: Full=Extended FMRFamide-12; Short=FMRFa-12 [Mantophasma kudubergense]
SPGALEDEHNDNFLRF